MQANIQENVGNLELKNLQKKLFSFFKGKGLNVKLTTKISNIDSKRQTTDVPVELVLVDNESVLAIVFYEGTMLNMVKKQVNEIDVDAASMTGYYQDLNKYKQNILSLLNKYSEEVKKMLPANMEVSYKDRNEYGQYIMYIRFKTTAKGGQINKNQRQSTGQKNPNPQPNQLNEEILRMKKLAGII